MSNLDPGREERSDRKVMHKKYTRKVNSWEEDQRILIEEVEYFPSREGSRRRRCERSRVSLTIGELAGVLRKLFCKSKFEEQIR